MKTDKDNLLEELSEFFSDESKIKFESYNGSILTLSVAKNKSEFKSLVNSIFDDAKELLNSKFEIKLSSVKLENTLVFRDEKDYFNNYVKYQDGITGKTILILSFKKSSIIKLKNENFVSEKALIFNYPVYRELLSYLISKNEFTPYHDNLDHRFVIISKDTGAFHIGYNFDESRLQEIDDLSTSFVKLKENFEKKEFIQFFKEIVIAGTHKKDDNDRFFELAKTLNVLLNLAERDYENYILDFAFDKIKTKFKEERNKYFESLEKGIDSVSKQVVSFPLTFAATAFASYQVQDKPVILGLIVLAYFLYTLIANKILHFVSYNVTCLVEDVNREEDEIKNSYNKLYADFVSDFFKIRFKIKKLQTILLYLKLILWGLLVLFVIYSSYQIQNIHSKNSDEQIIKISTSNIKMLVNGNKINVKDSVSQKNAKVDSIKSVKNQQIASPTKK